MKRKISGGVSEYFCILKKFMKKAILILILTAALAGFGVTETRPTRNYLIYFNDGTPFVIEADSVDDALRRFRLECKKCTVHSVARASYVESVWLGVTP